MMSLFRFLWYPRVKRPAGPAGVHDPCLVAYLKKEARLLRGFRTSIIGPLGASNLTVSAYTCPLGRGLLCCYDALSPI